MLGLGNLASLFDEVGVGAKGDVLHTISVSTILVRFASGDQISAPSIGNELRPDAYDGHKAARLGALFAVAEEEVGAAGGAKVADEDV